MAMLLNQQLPRSAQLNAAMASLPLKAALLRVARRPACCSPVHAADGAHQPLLAALTLIKLQQEPAAGLVSANGLQHQHKDKQLQAAAVGGRAGVGP